MNEQRIARVDNRDIETTRLYLEDGSFIEVNPWMLTAHALENSGAKELTVSLKILFLQATEIAEVGYDRA